jgi:homoserine O-acetyltransferase
MLVTKQIQSIGRFRLDSGRLLASVHLVFETYGKLNNNKTNAILVSHTLTSDQHAAGKYSQSDKKSGWWDNLIGDGKPIDTHKYFVICINALGGNGGSTSPKSIDLFNNKIHGVEFPRIEISDMVRAEKALMEKLGIPTWHCVIGGCMGGFKTLEWLRCYPALCHQAIVISTSHQVSVHTIASWYILKQCLLNHVHWSQQHESNSSLAFANMVGSMIWLTPDYLEAAFQKSKDSAFPAIDDIFVAEHPVEHFLDGIKNKEHPSADPHSLMVLMKAMSGFGISLHWPENLSKHLKRTLGISYEEDWRYPPKAMEKIVTSFTAQGISSQHLVLESSLGHSALIHDVNTLVKPIGDFLRGI